MAFKQINYTMPKMFILPDKISTSSTALIWQKEAPVEQAYQLARIADALERHLEALGIAKPREKSMCKCGAYIKNGQEHSTTCEYRNKN